MEISQDNLRQIVEAVMSNQDLFPQPKAQESMAAPRRGATIYDFVNKPPMAADAYASMGKGVYADVQQAIERAYQAQLQYMQSCSVSDRKRIIKNIRKKMVEHKETMARMALDESGLGRYEDKVAKVELAATKTPGVELLLTDAVSGDDGLTIEEMAPFGLVGGVTPVTNPMETIINNVIGLLAGGNSVVYNVHPSSKKTCAFTVDKINQAIVEMGGPEDMVTMVAEPSMESLSAIMKSDKVRLLLGTGGPGLVRSLLSSGKKAIGAAAGNPPVLVDETADLELAAKEIIAGASFDNNLLCIAEKEVFVVDAVADDLMFALVRQGAAMLTPTQATQVTELALEKGKDGSWHTKKEWIGKDATLFLKGIGAQANSDCKLLLMEADVQHPFVQLEQMMPVLPIVRVANVQEGMRLAVETEHGNRHTASIFSKNTDNITAFSKAINTTIFVSNASTMAGVGYGGEGYATFTIAGATGEGLTCARTFTRKRRYVAGNGNFRVI